MSSIEDGEGYVLGPGPLRFRNSKGELIAELNENALEGGAELIIHRGDIINVRNIQGGTVESPNLDISAGGDGSPNNPRGRVTVNYDNGKGFGVGRGRPTRKLAFDVRTYDDPNDDYALFNIPVRFKQDAYKWQNSRWVKLL